MFVSLVIVIAITYWDLKFQICPKFISRRIMYECVNLERMLY